MNSLKVLGARQGSFRVVPWQWGTWKVTYMGKNNLKNYMVMLTQEDAERIADKMNSKA